MKYISHFFENLLKYIVIILQTVYNCFIKIIFIDLETVDKLLSNEKACFFMYC